MVLGHYLSRCCGRGGGLVAAFQYCNFFFILQLPQFRFLTDQNICPPTFHKKSRQMPSNSSLLIDESEIHIQGTFLLNEQRKTYLSIFRLSEW